jgi:hypothetical protein
MPDFFSIAPTILFCFILVLAAFVVASRRLSWFTATGRR